MKKFSQIYTLIVGIGTVFFIIRFGLSISDSDDFNLRATIIVLLVAIISQLGFILSPFVLNTNNFIRIMVLLLMLPFSYFVIFHEFKSIYLYMLPLNSAGSSWKYNFGSNLIAIFVSFIWLIGYSYNAARLVFSIFTLSPKDEIYKYLD